jgi:hypothetical protein
MATQVPRLTLTPEGEVTCPAAGTPHEAHTDAVWFDWQRVEVWTCDGMEPPA